MVSSLILNFFCVLLGAVSTQEVYQRLKVNVVLASCATSLLFCGINQFTAQEEVLNLLFFGGSFIGMSTKKKVNTYQLVMASALFSLLFPYATTFFNGVGGTLGFLAFVSCLFTVFLFSFVKNSLMNQK